LDARVRDFDEMTGADEVLGAAALMLSNLWLDDMLRRALAPSLPQMQNTDGEPLEFMIVHFPLTSEAKLPRSPRRWTVSRTCGRMTTTVGHGFGRKRSPASLPRGRSPILRPAA
jgi:hypothetical protein